MNGEEGVRGLSSRGLHGRTPKPEEVKCEGAGVSASPPSSPGDKGRGPEVVRSRQGSGRGVDQRGQRVAEPRRGRAGVGGLGDDTDRGEL